MNSKVSILIDESGTLPDPKDKDKIISEQILNWKEAKAMIFANKNKKPHEPAQAPIQ